MNAPAALPQYEVYALRYATRDARRSSHFIGGDPHDAPMPMDYYLWLVRGNGRTVLVDTGFTAEVARQRGRTFLEDPVALLGRFGVAAEAIDDIVLSHLHYDHAGNLPAFPGAAFHVQDEEVSYATGRYMCHHRLRHGYEVDDVVELVRLVYKDRVRFYQGDAQLMPGLTMHRIGGHTAGLQCVRVNTTNGWLVLASDTAHFYENMESQRPFPTVFHMGDMLEGFNILRRLASSPRQIVPGHDPQVMNRYPSPSEAFRGAIVRLDQIVP